MHPVWIIIDPYLIWSFRLTGYALPDFLLGTFFMAWLALFMGEFSVSLVFLAIRPRVDAATLEARRYQDLSQEALSTGDKEAYTAANKLANDAFGRSFFMQVAMSAAYFWPSCVAIAWMGLRFSEVEFPLLFSSISMGFIGIYILMFAGAYLIFKRIKFKLPYFRRIKLILDSYDQQRSLAANKPDIHPEA